MSQRLSYAREYDVSDFVQSLARSKKMLVKSAKQCFDLSINLGIPFQEKDKIQFREKMIKLVDYEQKLKMHASIEEALKEMAAQSAENEENLDTKVARLLENLDFNVAFDQKIEETGFANVNSDQDYQELIRIIGLQENGEGAQGDEDIEMVDTGFAIPKDPFSRKEIEDPVRNIKCKHVYEKETFLSMFNSRNLIKCPVAGCANKRVTVHDVEDDLETKALIEKARSDQA